MRILALVPGGISQQILFFPTLKTLKENYPKALIDVVVEPAAKSAYRVCADVHEVLLFDFRDRNGLADYLNLLGIIRDREYEMAISLTPDWTIAMLLWLNGIPVRIGYKTNTSWFLTQAVELQPGGEGAPQYHQLLGSLGIEKPCPPLEISIPPEEQDWARAQQEKLGLGEKGYILVYGAPSDKVSEVQAKYPDVTPLLLQGLENGGEQWLVKMREKFPGLKVIPTLEVGKMAALMAGARAVAAQDSTLASLATAAGTEILG
jgi:ADP-heptose:LPS heptosyltransferase